MKALLTLLVLVLLAAIAYNISQLREMRKSLDEIRAFVEHERMREAQNDQALSAITRAIAQAQEAVSHADWTGAGKALERAQSGLEELGRTIGQKAAPTVKMLQEQAAGLLRQVEEHIASGDAKHAAPGR